jgi:serine/threonine-protein kinase HipA
MIKVWTDGAEAGLLDRFGERSSTFLYLPQVEVARMVSVTMPVRLASWDTPFGIAQSLR